MEEGTYRVVLLGINPDKDPDAVKRQLAVTFSSTPEKIEKMLARLPITVKTDLERKKALKYRDALEAAGCNCRVEQAGVAGGGTTSAGEAARASKSCPNCGYGAKTPDDPLLTAHDGQGECPACGIIVSKFSARRKPETAPEPLSDPEPSTQPEPTPEQAEKIPSRWDSIKSEVLAHPWISLMIVVSVIGMIVQFAIRDSASEKATATAKSPKSAVRATPVASENAVQNRNAAFRILPGESREAVLVTHMDYLHRDEFAPLNFTPIHTVDNKWEDLGLRVEIRDFRITPVSVTLWEHRSSDSDFWVPAGYKKIVSFGSSRGIIEKGKNLLLTSFPSSLVKKPDETSMKISEGDPDFRKSAYTMYRLEYDLSITVPSGPEFGASITQAERNARFCVNTFATWDNNSDVEAMISSAPIGGGGPWRASKMGSMNKKLICLNMKHDAVKGGLIITPGERECEMPMYCELEMR